ncbi:hypothetical protein [Novipirellula caenicola]|uniref:Uncharacterized protein n=1 Tax=Novipirellula caenicola TaxID=1536901 RepID=A0ABP9W1M1_9BACT
MRSFSVLSVLGIGLLCCVVLTQDKSQEASAADDVAAAQNTKVYTVTYRLEDLPVWSKDGHFDYKLICMLIHSSISPKSWEALGGPSTMAPYPQNFSLVVSTTSDNHDALSALFKQLRR